MSIEMLKLKKSIQNLITHTKRKRNTNIKNIHHKRTKKKLKKRPIKCNSKQLTRGL